MHADGRNKQTRNQVVCIGTAINVLFAFEGNFLFIFIEKPQTFRHVNVHMIYSVHTYVSRGSTETAVVVRPGQLFRP